MLLELKYGASQEEILTAYEKLQEIFNPDYFTDNATLQEKVKYKCDEIRKAYEYLMNDMQNGDRTPATQKPSQPQPLAFGSFKSLEATTQTQPTFHPAANVEKTYDQSSILNNNNNLSNASKLIIDIIAGIICWIISLSIVVGIFYEILPEQFFKYIGMGIGFGIIFIIKNRYKIRKAN